MVGVVIALSGLCGSVVPALADLPMMSAPTKIGAQCATRQDYVSAMLAYDEQLKQDPFDHTAMKHLVSCHEAMLQQDQADKAAAQALAAAPAKAAESDEFADLPKFDDALAAKP